MKKKLVLTLTLQFVAVLASLAGLIHFLWIMSFSEMIVYLVIVGPLIVWFINQMNKVIDDTLIH